MPGDLRLFEPQDQIREGRVVDAESAFGTGKRHLAQALGHAAIQQGHRVLYREAHVLLEELTDATLEGRGRRSSAR